MNESKASIDSAQTGNSVGNLGDTELKKETRGNSKDIAKATNQMVIYQADLRIRVKKFEQTLQILEGKVEKYGGYIAESNVIKEGKEHEREY